MNKSELIELINKKFDNEISRQENVRLNKAIEQDSSARQLYQELLFTTDALDRLPLVNPPAELSKKIMKQITTRSAPSPSPLTGRIRDYLSDFVLPRRDHALAFAAGLIIGITVIFFITQDKTGSDYDYTGTIGLTDQAEFIYSENFRLNTGTVQAEFTYEQYAQEIKLHIDVRSADVYQIAIRSDSDNIYFSGLQTLDANKVDLHSQDAGLSITGYTDNHIVLTWSAPNILAGSMVIELQQKDQPPVMKEILLKKTNF